MSALVYVALSAAAGLAIGRFGAHRPPYAAPACALAAIVGSVLLSLPLGNSEPRLLGVAIIPALAGACAGALLVRLLLQRLVVRASA